MNRDKYYYFLKDITALCHRYSLYIEGDNMRIESAKGNPIGGKLEYDMEGQSYTADYNKYFSKEIN